MYVCTGIKCTWKNNKKLITMCLEWGARWLRPTKMGGRLTIIIFFYLLRFFFPYA